MTHRTRGRLFRRGLACGAVSAAMLTVAMPTGAQAALAGVHPALTRAPYLSDLTTTSVQVTWASTVQSHAVVRYGPLDRCTENVVTSVPNGSPITVNGMRQYQNSVRVTGLAPGGSYCYRVYTDGAAPIDLLGTNASPRFATLSSPTSTATFSFLVIADWGDTTNNGVNTGGLNQSQAKLMALMAKAGARFVVSVGDVAYPSGSQTNYGDLKQTGLDVSSVFGPSYWAVPGLRLPVFATSGNHGRNANFLRTWPQSAIAAVSGGVYSMVDYPSIGGTIPGAYPTSYYAFTTAGVRFYVLDSAWNDRNVGRLTGGVCGDRCRPYEADYEAHWRSTSAQMRWLQQDLASHPGGLKIAFFHYPLRSDAEIAPSDRFLQNQPGTQGRLEQVLHDGGVNLVFNGHAHIYQRSVPQPGGVTSYVVGGGGAKLIRVGFLGCAPTDAYALGWYYKHQRGESCGTAPAPTSTDQVHHFVKVTVSGTTLTVAPVNALGRQFDVATYDFGDDQVPPSAPGALTEVRTTPDSVTLDWTVATDNIGVTAYDIYRDEVLVATVAGTVTAFTDQESPSELAHRYVIRSRDLAGNTGSAAVFASAPAPAPPVPAPPAALVRGGQ